jgi:hypothetical protein
MFYAINIFQGRHRDLVNLADRVSNRGTFIRKLRIILRHCIEADFYSRSLALKNIVHHLFHILKSHYPGLERVFAHLDAELLQDATKEHVLGMLKSAWVEGVEGPDVEFVLYFES